MNIFKVVLTGGPGSGKTTVYNKLVEYYKNKGDCFIITVPETASELINSGIRPDKCKSIQMFQEIVFKRQILKEETALDGLLNSKETKQNNIIIYDRGVLDNKAYLDSQKDFDKIICDTKYNELEILDSYDLVIDLMSTAGSDICKYEKETNKARFEDENEAVKLQAKTSWAWVNHRNLKIVDVKENVDDKVEEVISYINELIESKQNKIVSRYVIEKPDLSKYNYSAILIDKYFLGADPFSSGEIIAEKRTGCQSSTCVLKVEKQFDSIIRTFQNIKIDKYKLERLLNYYGSDKHMMKRRMSFIDNKQIYNVDVYNECEDNECYVLEIEKQNGIEEIIPSEFKVITKLKEDFDYNRALDTEKQKQLIKRSRLRG